MTLFEMSMTGCAMIVLIIVLRALLMNHLPKRTFVCLWALALIRLMLPFSIPVHMPWTVPEQVPSAMPVAVSQVRTFARQNLPVNAWPGIAAFEQSPAIIQAQPWPASPAQIPAEPLPAKQVSWLAVIYFTGAALVGLYLLSAYVLLRREFKKSRELTDGPAFSFVRAHNLRRQVRVLASGRIKSPITYGLIRPCVLLPESMVNDTAQLPYVLTHELTHIKRLDAPMKLLFVVCLCLHWFNPLVWAMYILYNRDVELACDERVVRVLGTAERAGYAQLLLHMQEGRNRLTPLCNSFSRYSLKERIVSISKYKKTSALMMMLALVLVAGIATGFATRAEQAPIEPTVATGQSEAIDEMDAGLRVLNALRRRDLLQDVLPWDRELPWSVSIHELPPDPTQDYGETYATARQTYSDVLRLEITRYEESSLPEQVYVGVRADGSMDALAFTPEQQGQLLALTWEKSGSIELSGIENQPEYTPMPTPVPGEEFISLDDIEALIAEQLYDGWIEGVAPLEGGDSWRLYGTEGNGVYLLQIRHAGNAAENIYLKREGDVFLRYVASSFPAVWTLLASGQSERYDDVEWEDDPLFDIPQPEPTIAPNYAPLPTPAPPYNEPAEAITPSAAWLDQKWDESAYKQPDPRVVELMALPWQNMSVAAFNQEVRRAIDTEIDGFPLAWQDLFGTYEDSAVSNFIFGPLQRAMIELGDWNDEDGTQWHPGDPHGSSAFVIAPSLEAYADNAPYVLVDYLLICDTLQPDAITVAEREEKLVTYQARMSVWFNQREMNELVQGDLLSLIRAERDRLTNELSTPELHIRAINFHGRYFDGTKVYETPGDFADNMENPPNDPPVDDPDIEEIHYSNLTKIRVGTIYKDVYDEDWAETKREDTDYFVSMGGQDRPWHKDGWRDPATGLSIKFFPELGWPLISPDNGETWWRESVPDGGSPDGSMDFHCVINTISSQDLHNWILWYTPTSGWRMNRL